MSDTVTAPPAGENQSKPSRISEAVIRLAGNSQDGIQAIGGFLARLAGRIYASSLITSGPRIRWRAALRAKS